MAFKEVLHIQPKLDSGDLSKMESALTSRFHSIAKKFGKGLVDVLKGGGIVGAVTLIADKLLNPLKEVKEAIDRALHSADDLKDQATRFNTTPAQLAKIQAIGKAKGLDPAEVNDMIGKFQNAVAQNSADPSQNHAVKNFVGVKDTGVAFLNFMENTAKLAKKDSNAAIRVETETFGERKTGRAANFLNADIPALEKKLFKNFDPEKFNKNIEKLSEFKGIQQESGAIRDINDVSSKAKAITKKTILDLEAQKDIAQQREDRKIENTKGLLALETKADALIAFLETKGLSKIGEGVEQLESIADKLGVISRLRALKGLFGKKE